MMNRLFQSESVASRLEGGLNSRLNKKCNA